MTTNFLKRLYNRVMARFNKKHRISINLKDNINNNDNKFPATIVQSCHGTIQQISHHPMARFNKSPIHHGAIQQKKKAAFYGGNMI
jgi:hypothetical protein